MIQSEYLYCKISLGCCLLTTPWGANVYTRGIVKDKRRLNVYVAVFPWLLLETDGGPVSQPVSHPARQPYNQFPSREESRNNQTRIQYTSCQSGNSPYVIKTFNRPGSSPAKWCFCLTLSVKNVVNVRFC